MSRCRRFGAISSLLLLLSAVCLGFSFLQGERHEVTLLSNRKFKYLVVDPATNMSRPYFWELDAIKGPSDRLNLTSGYVAGWSALQMEVYQDGEEDEYVWAMIHLRQDLTEEKAENLFFSKIGAWVFPTFSYTCDERTKDPANSFGIEVNDGVHILWFIFSDENVGVYLLSNHRIAVIYCPLNEWSFREVQISTEYEKVGWARPESFSFMVMMGLTQGMPGKRVGFFREITIEIPQKISSKQRSELRTLWSYAALGEAMLVFFSFRSICAADMATRTAASELEAMPTRAFRSDDATRRSSSLRILLTRSM